MPPMQSDAILSLQAAACLSTHLQPHALLSLSMVTGLSTPSCSLTPVPESRW